MKHSFHYSMCFIVVVVAVTIVLSIEEQYLCQALSLETTLQELRQDRIPGIWKLTTSALPYDTPLPKTGYTNDDGNGAETEASAAPTILLKLNRDGTFKQCDEGYAEGRWITGRWKVKLLESSVVEENKSENSNADEPLDESNDDENKSLFLLLVLAMNRQYFGPPYDVLLESAKFATTVTIASDGDGRGNKQENEQAVLSISSNLSSLQHWQGEVRRGKFRRPSPGKHVLDDDNVSVLQTSDTTTGSRSNLLSNSKVLGNFSLEQALAWTSMDRKQRRRGANGKTNAKENDIENTKERSSTTTATTTSARPNDEGMARSIEDDENDDDTFFVPNSNQGVLE